MDESPKELSLESCATLNNGFRMPLLGLGLAGFQANDEAYRSVLHALEVGYRSVDTARLYKNEADVGRAILDSGLKREEIFVTTKVWNDAQGYDACLRSIERSLELLQTSYIDLFLIHWPIKRLSAATYQAMCEAYEKGWLRALGVSNFMQHHFHLLDDAPVPPTVNQVECNPFNQMEGLRFFCEQRNIVLEAWKPIIAGEVNQIPILQQLAKRYGKTPVQITIRWHLQRGIIVIPKSSRLERIKANADVFDFQLEQEDMQAIAQLDGKGMPRHPEPDTFSYNL